MREHNPYLMLLAVFVFGSGTGSKKIRREIAKSVSEDLGQSSDMLLESFIRHAESVANEMVKYGLLAYELEQEIAEQPEVLGATQGQRKERHHRERNVTTGRRGLREVAAEVLTRAAKRRAEMIEQGVWP